MADGGFGRAPDWHRQHDGAAAPAALRHGPTAAGRGGPPPPGARFIWEPGHWHWNGVQYVWVGGHYVERRPHYGHYAPGHWIWSPRLGRYEWIPAHWE